MTEQDLTELKAFNDALSNALAGLRELGLVASVERSKLTTKPLTLPQLKSHLPRAFRALANEHLAQLPPGEPDVFILCYGNWRVIVDRSNDGAFTLTYEQSPANRFDIARNLTPYIQVSI